MAIEDSPQRALPVKEIYAWILEHFPYFKNAPTGWKNSVRHNLSLNKCFRKVEKAPVSCIVCLDILGKTKVFECTRLSGEIAGSFFIFFHGSKILRTVEIKETTIDDY
jgi:hypothetical protein